MRCVIKKAQSYRPEELPVKKTQTPGLITPAPSSANLEKLTIPGNPFFANPSGPNTPAYFSSSTSPTFGFPLETPSPTLGAFQFSISPTLTSFPFIGADMPTVETPTSKQPENKKLETPKPPSTPKLTLVLKRKRDDEYVIKDFQLPDNLPSSEDNMKQDKSSLISDSASKLMEQSALDSIPPPLDTKTGTDGVNPFSMLTSPFDVQPSTSNISLEAASISMAASALGGSLPGAIDSIPGAELFELTSGVSDGSSVHDLEGILSSLPGASHLSVDAGLDFDTGLGKNTSRDNVIYINHA